MRLFVRQFLLFGWRKYAFKVWIANDLFQRINVLNFWPLLQQNWWVFQEISKFSLIARLLHCRNLVVRSIFICNWLYFTITSKRFPDSCSQVGYTFVLAVAYVEVCGRLALFRNESRRGSQWTLSVFVSFHYILLLQGVVFGSLTPNLMIGIRLPSIASWYLN